MAENYVVSRNRRHRDIAGGYGHSRTPDYIVGVGTGLCRRNGAIEIVTHKNRVPAGSGLTTLDSAEINHVNRIKEARSDMKPAVRVRKDSRRKRAVASKMTAPTTRIPVRENPRLSIASTPSLPFFPPT